uniref:PTBP1-like RNA recognition motif 2 domain-containing protein n=1 Tax=Leersia perrieri TaxID=77586 RepID=A0A0D9WFD6_9ORYZ
MIRGLKIALGLFVERIVVEGDDLVLVQLLRGSGPECRVKLQGIRATDPWEFEHRQGVGEQFEHRQGVGEASGAVRIYLVVFTEEVRTTCSVKCQTGGQRYMALLSFACLLDGNSSISGQSCCICIYRMKFLLDESIGAKVFLVVSVIIKSSLWDLIWTQKTRRKWKAKDFCKSQGMPSIRESGECGSTSGRRSGQVLGGGVFGGGAHHLFGEMPDWLRGDPGAVLRVAVSHIVYTEASDVLHQVYNAYGAMVVQELYIGLGHNYIGSGEAAQMLVPLTSHREYLDATGPDVI